MNPLLRGILRDVARTGAAGFNQFTRSYHKYRAFSLPGMALPKTQEEGKTMAQYLIDTAREAGAFNYTFGILNVVTLPEFAYNGHISDGDWRSNASQRVEPEVFAAIVTETQRLLRAESPGIAWCGGTAAINTGKMIEGKRVCENRGFIMSSGPDSDIVEFTKKNTSQIDNWEEGVMVQGDGPVLFKIKDVLGTGITRSLAVAVCLDYDKELTSGKVSFPISPDLIVCPAAGWPIKAPIQNIDVLVADAMHNSFWTGVKAGGFDWTRPWTPVMKDPMLKNFITAMIDGFPMGSSVMAAIGMSILSSPKMQEYLEPKRVMSKLPYELKKIDGREIIVCEPRSFPDQLTDERIGQTLEAIEKDGATLISDGAGQSEVDAEVKKITDLAQNLPWDYVQEEIEGTIDKQVTDALGKMNDPFAKSIDDLMKSFDMAAFTDVAQQRLNILLYEAMVGDPDFLTLNLEESSAKWLVEQAVTKPTIDRMIATMEGSNWTTEVIRRALLSQKAHALAQAADSIQQRAAEAASRVKATTAELSAKQEALAEVKEHLQTDPNNPDLQKQRDEIQSEINRLVQEQQEAQQDKSNADGDLVENTKDAQQTEDEIHEVDPEIKQRGQEVFHGE